MPSYTKLVCTSWSNVKKVLRANAAPVKGFEVEWPHMNRAERRAHGIK